METEEKLRHTKTEVQKRDSKPLPSSLKKKNLKQNTSKKNLISYKNGASTQHSKGKSYKIYDLSQTTICKYQLMKKVKI